MFPVHDEESHTCKYDRTLLVYDPRTRRIATSTRGHGAALPHHMNSAFLTLLPGLSKRGSESVQALKDWSKNSWDHSAFYITETQRCQRSFISSYQTLPSAGRQTSRWQSLSKHRHVITTRQLMSDHIYLQGQNITATQVHLWLVGGQLQITGGGTFTSSPHLLLLSSSSRTSCFTVVLTGELERHWYRGNYFNSDPVCCITEELSGTLMLMLVPGCSQANTM